MASIIFTSTNTLLKFWGTMWLAMKYCSDSEKGRQCGSHVNNSVRLDKEVLYLIVKIVKVAETRGIDYLYLLEDRCIAAHIKIIQLAGEEIQQTRKPVTAQVVLGKGNTLAVFEHSLHRRALTV